MTSQKKLATVLQEGKARPSALAGQRGVALVFVLFALTLLSVLSLTFLTDTQIESKMVSTSRDFNLALYAAEAGIQEALVRLNMQDRSARKEVNGGKVRVWIPSDTRTLGSDEDPPLSWRFVHNDNVNNDEWPGISDKIDDWAEYDPRWQANIWYSAPGDVTSSGEGWQMSYPTLVEIDRYRPDGLVRRLLEHSVAADDANANRGLLMRWKIENRHDPDPASWRMIFTDGYQQFTAAEGWSTLKKTEAWPVIEIHAVGRYGRANRRYIGEAARLPLKIPRTAVYACSPSPPAFKGAGNMIISGFDYPILNSAGEPNGSRGAGVVNPPLPPSTNRPVPALTVCCPARDPDDSLAVWGPGACNTAGREKIAAALQVDRHGNTELYGVDTGDGDPVAIGELDVNALYRAFEYYISPGPHDWPVSPADARLMEWGGPSAFYVNRIVKLDDGVSVFNPPNGMIGGVLLVNTGQNEGVVRFAAGTTIYGLVIAVGNGTVDFRGNAEIFGSVLAGTDISIKGTATVYYSSQALDRIEELQVHRLIRIYETEL
jgi:hypothetical protein